MQEKLEKNSFCGNYMKKLRSNRQNERSFRIALFMQVAQVRGYELQKPQNSAAGFGLSNGYKFFSDSYLFLQILSRFCSDFFVFSNLMQYGYHDTQLFSETKNRATRDLAVNSFYTILKSQGPPSSIHVTWFLYQSPISNAVARVRLAARKSDP